MAQPPLQEPDDLSRVLHAWRVDPQDDPQLAHKVWQRIGNQKPSTFRVWLDSVARLLGQPAAAAAAILLFAAAGAAVAEVTEGSARETRIEQLASEYARSIDPVLMHDTGTAPVAHRHQP